MNYKIEKLLKDSYGSERFAIIHVGNGYCIAFEDDYGVMFDNGLVIDNYRLYHSNDKAIRKTGTPKKDWDDMMTLVKFAIKNGKHEGEYEYSELPLPVERIEELREKYELEDLGHVDYSELAEMEINELDTDDWNYDKKIEEIKEKYSMHDDYYWISSEIICNFFLKKGVIDFE